MKPYLLSIPSHGSHHSKVIKLFILLLFFICITYHTYYFTFFLFSDYAQLIGFSNFITFDKVYVPFHGNFCKYLLSHDFMEDEFSLVLNSDDTNAEDQRSISLLISGEEITVQFTPLVISLYYLNHSGT